MVEPGIFFCTHWGLWNIIEAMNPPLAEKRMQLDGLKEPSRKKYNLCSVPYYLLTRLDDVAEQLVA